MSRKNILKYLILSVVLLFQLIQVGTINSYASSGNVSVYVTTDSTSIGNAVSASVTVGLDQALGAYTVYISYDPSVLQYDGGSGALINGGAGTIAISGVGDGSSTSQSINLNFTAIGNGYSNVAASGEVYDWNDGYSSVSYGASGVTVATNDSSNNSSNDNNSNDDSNDESNTTEDNKSSNCNLSSLQISPGSLVPTFSSDTTYYEVTVPEDTTSMVVSATTENADSTIYIAGAGLIEPGDNTVSITVTAPNGATKTYTLSVTAGEKKVEAYAMINNKKYLFAMEEEGLNIPEQFKATTAKYNEFDVLAFESPNKKIKVVCLVDEEKVNYWFVINEENGELIPFITYSSKYNRYYIIDFPENITIPEGYEISSISISGNNVTAYQYLVDSNIFLVYAINIDGEEGLYLYDNIEGSFIRYIEPFVKEEEQIEVATPTEPVILPNNDGFFTKEILLYIAIGIGALSFVFLIIMIVFMAKSIYYKKQLEEAEDMMLAMSEGNKSAVDTIVESFYDDSTIDDQNEKMNNLEENDNKISEDSAFTDSAFTNSAFFNSSSDSNNIIKNHNNEVDEDEKYDNEQNDNQGIDLIKLDNEDDLD